MEVHQHTFDSNIKLHDNDKAPFTTTDMWVDNIVNTPTMKQTDSMNDLVSSNLLNSALTDQTLSSLEPQSGWYEPLEATLSSSATSIEGAPNYTTNMDKIDNHGMFQNPLLDATANLNNGNLYNQPTIEEPLPLPIQQYNNNEIKIKKESSHQLTFQNANEKFNDISAPSTYSKNTKTAGVKKQRKKLTDNQKLAHNKIEKRYRININTKIAKLQQIIPWVASNGTAFEVSHVMNASRSNSVEGKGAGKVNKSKILDKAVDYIQFLQDNEQIFLTELKKIKEENDELRAALASYQRNQQRYSS